MENQKSNYKNKNIIEKKKKKLKENKINYYKFI
jgi:hypothetical protein